MSKPWAAGSPTRLGNVAGNASAKAEFEDFFRRHHRELARLAYSMTGNRAESDDVVGEALASAWEHWDRVQGADSPLAYVRKIVVNLSVERVRTAVRDRQRHRLMTPLTKWFYHPPDIGGAVDLQAAVLALPPGRRACVVMRHVLDLPEEEVARTLGISLGTVKSQTSKGLAQLRSQLDPGRVATSATSTRTTRKEA
ncbi:SigE family RNA polymerase sigma factor [Kineosporia mesophila]|uniref:SigE family RNA polymerase sigma factor n=1 Tax=Kineosporia mesophila TaxID=566012 RepID=A0ABP6ZEP3_9ACTN|nr:SigE family RNA polymerase sigma factor [Kineosporia mesophila]MCD5350269.1 SigE family RNA polymerase sigma factor [Kineosporia mesophila]